MPPSVSVGGGQDIEVSLGVTIGDLGYNLDIPPRGDNFIGGLSSGLGSQFPWMVAPGNHEADCNYTYANYLGRSLYSYRLVCWTFKYPQWGQVALGV